MEEENLAKPKYVQTNYTFKNPLCRTNNITIAGKKCKTNRIGGSRLNEFDFEANKTHIMNKISLSDTKQILIDTSGLIEGDNMVDLVAYTAGNVEAFLHFNVRVSKITTNYAPTFETETLEGFSVEIKDEGDTAKTTYVTPVAQDSEENEIIFEVSMPNYPFLSYE